MEALMNGILKAFTSVKLNLLVLLLASLATHLSIELYLVKIPARFNGAYEIGQFFSKISISYITGFIFYFIVVHLKNESDKRNINEYVGHEVYGIITDGHLLIQPLMQIDDKKARFRDLDRKKLYELLAKIDPLAKEAPLIRNDEKVTWIEWYADQIGSTMKHIQNIFQRLNYIDTKLIKLLTRIENSIFIKQFDFLVRNSREQKLNIYQPQIDAYLNLIEELEHFAEKHFREYQYLRNEFIGWKPYGR